MHCPLRPGADLKRSSVLGLARPISLHIPDGFIQGFRCPEILQDLLAVLGTSIPHKFQDVGVAFESFSFGGLARYAYSG